MHDTGLQSFHPALQAWFNGQFDAPTQVQKQSWEAINRGEHTLLAAPTGSGKTLAAFMASINQLLIEGLKKGYLEDETRVLYISPLKALSNDIQLNLQEPIQGIRDQLLTLGKHDVDIRAWVRTGDTPQSERTKAARKPPQILVTTPESIYILLTSESGRNLLKTVNTVIVDEIHAIAGSKRGSHLMLSLERLEGLIKQHDSSAKLQRIGLSATQKPIKVMADFLLGNRSEKVTIIDTGHVRHRDLAIKVPDSPLNAIMSNEIWDEIYRQLIDYTKTHKTVLIFVNTRRLAERVARFISEGLEETKPDNQVMAHHGSMAKEKRLEAEQRLKRGDLKCLVATASLELGIDIGDIDLVVQLGSPRSIAAFLQRVGRSGHKIGGTPKGRLFPLSRDDLVESTALLQAAHQGKLDRVIIPEQAMDVLAQHIVAEVSGQEWEVDALYTVFSQAYPYRHLSKERFLQVVKMLADGYSTRRGRRGAYVHYDAINGRIRPRKGSRLIALTNGGAIPDLFDCEVILQPEGFRIGSVGEDFAFESMPGDIFQLGNRSYRILKSETGKLFVQDAEGQPPNLPFWLGEAPGRTDELSSAVSELRYRIDQCLETEDGVAKSIRYLQSNYTLSLSAAKQLTEYLATAKAALGVLPSQKNIVFERFFDEVGDMHFVIHSPYGSRINKAWGLALRKRFCRKFNFELQAAALEDSIVLSLSSTHSFPMEEVSRYLNANTVEAVLIQALLDAPLFPARWRWNATISLAVLRNRFGKRSPPYFQRSDAEDLMAVVFPDQIACLENIAGERQVPDHPLVAQTIHDCLHETMDINGLKQVLQGIAGNTIRVHCCDLTSPSPLAQEVITARPYAFLDDGEAEERRTMAIQSQPFMNLEDAKSLRQINPAAINKVCNEAWPLVRTADECHDALMLLGFISETETAKKNIRDQLDFGWHHFFDELIKQQRCCLIQPSNSKTSFWVATERLHEFMSVFPELTEQNLPTPIADVISPEVALTEILRSRLEGLGPITAAQLAEPLGLSVNDINASLLMLEQEGFIIQGTFTQSSDQLEWCDRRLLARIHRYSIKQKRNEIRPVSISQMMQFLFVWQGLTEKTEGIESLARVLTQLSGISASASAWQQYILPARINNFSSDMLDTLCLSGRFNWLRLNVANTQNVIKKSPVTQSPIALLPREQLDKWRQLIPAPETYKLSPYATVVLEKLTTRGALFFNDMVQETGLLRTQLEDALGELVNWGLITSDAYTGLKALITPSAKRPKYTSRKRGVMSSLFDHAGRWSLLTTPASSDTTTGNSLADDELSFIAQNLLNRYGIVVRKLLEREPHLPPWRDLLRVFWRMEARGEIRGGRFVESISGEQFALPEALNLLKNIKNQPEQTGSITISSADPLNLVGSLIPGEKIPVTPLSQLIFENGVFKNQQITPTNRIYQAQKSG